MSVMIPEDASVGQIAEIFGRHGIVRSPYIFRVYLVLSGKDRTIVPGLYLFDEPLSVISVARRIAGGDHGVVTRKITFPEGMTIAEFSAIAARELPLVREEEFIRTAGDEGYLFPDTYFFYETATSGDVTATLRDNFIAKTKDLRAEAAKGGSDLSWDQIVTLASIVEEESATPKDRRIVAGILLRRLDIGMPLQVDATFGYTIGKGSLQLTEKDLANKEDLYNTYRHKGLPPGAIANTGLDAIEAVIRPVKTNYLYYLSDSKGEMHYAVTFDEHKVNKEKYIK